MHRPQRHVRPPAASFLEPKTVAASKLQLRCLGGGTRRPNSWGFLVAWCGPPGASWSSFFFTRSFPRRHSRLAQAILAQLRSQDAPGRRQKPSWRDPKSREDGTWKRKRPGAPFLIDLKLILDVFFMDFGWIWLDFYWIFDGFGMKLG